MSGKLRNTCYSRMTGREINFAIVNLTTSATARTSATSRCASLLVRLRTKAEDYLVAIHDIDIEMDGNTRAPRSEKRLTGEVKILRAKRCDPPPSYVGETVPCDVAQHLPGTLSGALRSNRLAEWK